MSLFEDAIDISGTIPLYTILNIVQATHVWWSRMLDTSAEKSEDISPKSL